ncbi:hypothetical protein LCGC14_2418880 [marine sediment metagenome]|uniref:Uncharacterized protein n=1 Tax=marine sediment metagenome TaxID=412755 RepID=A0A0F9E2D4_9ZZZZ
MATTTKGVGFEYKGLDCTITERPDLCFLYKVHGCRKSDNTVWMPNLLFERYLTAEQIENACIAIIDGTFAGKVEQCGAFNVMVGV